jgi:hypothetical protein
MNKDIASHNVETESTCPTCGEKMDGATNATLGETSAPKPGDLSICAYCGTALSCGEGMVIHELTRAEIKALSYEEALALVHARAVVFAMNGPFRHPRGNRQ